MNAGANYILASYMSLFGPFSPHAPLPYVTKLRFFSRISLVVPKVPRYMYYMYLDSSSFTDSCVYCPL